MNKASERSMRWRRRNKERVAKYDADYRLQRRWMLINELGAKCIKCGYSDYRALQFDHIIPAFVNRVGRKRWVNPMLISEDDLKNLQLLCANCNAIKKIMNNECGMDKKGRLSEIYQMLGA